MNHDDEIMVNPIAEQAIVDLLSSIFDGIAYLDSETVRYNVLLACEGGMSKEDRSIRVELGNYLMSHFGIIFAGLVINNDFREAFTEAVSTEISLDDMPADKVSVIRNAMRDTVDRSSSSGNFVINLGSFNDKIYRKINSKLLDSFGRIDSFSDAVDDFIRDLTDDERIDIGFVVSNFMYLVRAFSKNAVFTFYVKSVVHDVMQKLGIK
jgi:hypothetical protein